MGVFLGFSGKKRQRELLFEGLTHFFLFVKETKRQRDNETTRQRDNEHEGKSQRDKENFSLRG